MRVLLAGGGTGGHIYPAVTIARALQEKGAQVRFVGAKDRLEAHIVPREGFSIDFISVDYFPRRLSWRLVKAGWTAAKSVNVARKIISDYNPDVCIGTGGYVSGPVVLAAALKKIPIVIQEQNAFPGLTNRWLARVAAKVALTFPEAASYFKNESKLAVTGNPVRSDIVAMDRREARRRLGLQDGTRLVLIFGGSQGARSINEAVWQAKSAWRDVDATFLIVTGRSEFHRYKTRLLDETTPPSLASTEMSSLEAPTWYEEKVRFGNVMVVPYVYDMAAALAAAELVVCRASAGSISELTAKALPSILIPYPHAAGNHQEKNARVLEAAEAAEVILDEHLTGDELFRRVSALLGDRQRMERMARASRSFGKPDAVWDIVALVEQVVRVTH